MSVIPEIIYLQTDGENSFGNDIDDLDYDTAVTWCTDQINNEDTKYIRVDIILDLLEYIDCTCLNISHPPCIKCRTMEKIK